MAGEWTTRKLADCCDFNPTSLKADWPHARLRYIDISSVGEGIQSEPFKLMLRTDAPSRAQRLVASGDSLLSTVRPNRRSMLWLGSVADNVVASTGFAVLRAKPAAMSSRYLYYTVFNRAFTDYLVTMEKGAAYPAVSVADIGDAEITLPPLAEQKAIAAVLGALDDKIELNRRMNATLEAMARALFQSWFVDFDPVRAKLDGRKPVGLDDAIAALFPDSFQDSLLGQIPKGWEISTLGSILDVLETGRRPKGGVSSYTSGIPSIGAESINGIGVFDYSKTKFIPPEFFEKTLSGRIAHFDVLLYKDGGKPGEFKPRVGMYGHEFPFKTSCINEHVFRMRSTRTGQSFLYFIVSDQRVLSDFANKGGKAAIPGINQPDVKSTPIVLPSKGITDAFNARADILCNQILCNAKQSRTLATLRDALLPKLLSGDLSVDKIKEGLVA